MNVTHTSLPEVLVLTPDVYEDDRGFFFESWNQRSFREATGFVGDFVQDNHSRSVAGVIRGLHYQDPDPQGKLVRVVSGAIWDVAVDIRPSSEHFCQWVGVELTADNRRQLWVPPGFAHGFLALSEEADVLYKTTAAYNPSGDRCVRFDDPSISISWPPGTFRLSDKDRRAPTLMEALGVD
ncbi:MAG: dTDP-4-dehydrorhamnose 3,5-epimerase, partial [Acidimicrobiia bacterium]|nr:dTDP-4-dehydrorhamnose 3,5-epimerase [Acidimicrobiia bacterium]